MTQEYINTIKKLKEENQKLLNDIQVLKKQNLYGNKYLEVYNEVPVGIILFDNKLNVVDVNKTFLKIFNINKNQICGFGISEVTDKRILPSFEQTKKGHEGFYEGRYHTNFTDLELFVSIHTKPATFKNNSEIINGGIAIVNDITEHSIAERAVNKSYDTFQRVTDNVNAIIFVIEPITLKVLFLNNKAKIVFGNDKKTDNKTLLSSAKECEELLKRHNLPIGKFKNLDFYDNYYKKWYQISYGYIEWVDGRKVMLLTPVDITSEKISHTKIQEQNRKFEDTLHRLTLQNEQINKQSDELKVSGAIKDTMFSIIAHDLRGPVGNITTALDIIIDDIDDIDKQEILEIIRTVRDSAGSAYNLLVNLLFWAKNESGETFFIREEILLNDIIEDVLTLFKPNFESKNIKLINQISNEYYVFADEHMIHTVVRNIISNAIKYTNTNGLVEIGMEKYFKANIEYVKLWVKDNGIGISDEDINKMMNSKQFFSTYGTNKEKGTGLGIILTKEFIERHNGEMIIESEVGEGTTIIFLLPVEKN